MRTPIQPPLSIEHDDPVVDFDTEDIGGQHARNPDALPAEIDGIGEALRLNWLELEHLEVAQTDRRAIRAPVTRLDHILTGWLALSPRRANTFGAPETEGRLQCGKAISWLSNSHKAYGRPTPDMQRSRTRCCAPSNFCATAPQQRVSSIAKAISFCLLIRFAFG